MKIKILLVLIVVYPLLFLFQGGDLTDVGFHCTNYMYFDDFISFYDGQFYMMILTNYIGHFWYKLFSEAGLLSFKILYLIFLYGSLFISYLILNTSFKNQTQILFGLFFGEVFVTRYTSFVFSYDIASWFFLTLSIFFFLCSLNKKSLSFAIFCGFSVALASLCRAPSFAAISIGLLYFFSEKLNSGKTKTMFLMAFIFGLACFLYAAFIFLDLDISTLSNILNNANNYGNGNNALINIYGYFYDFLSLILCLFFFLVFFYLFQKTELFFKKSLQLFFMFLLITILVMFYFNFSPLNYNSNKVFGYGGNIKYLIPILISFPIILNFCYQKKDRIPLMCIILCGLAQVLGTNSGLLLKFCFGCMLLIPIAVIYINDFSLVERFKILKDNKLFFMVSLFLILGLSILSRGSYIYHVASGLKVRVNCLDKIKHTKMKGLLTNYRHATIIEKSLEINRLKDEKIFVYGHRPILYFLTGKKPSIYPFWIYNHNSISITKKLNSLDSLPIIYDTKENVFGEKHAVELGEFLKKNQYTLTKNDGYGSLWVPYLRQ